MVRWQGVDLERRFALFCEQHFCSCHIFTTLQLFDVCMHMLTMRKHVQSLCCLYIHTHHDSMCEKLILFAQYITDQYIHTIQLEQVSKLMFVCTIHNWPIHTYHTIRTNVKADVCLFVQYIIDKYIHTIRTSGKLMLVCTIHNCPIHTHHTIRTSVKADVRLHTQND